VWLMAAASDPLRTSTASRLMEGAARVWTVSEKPARPWMRSGTPVHGRWVARVSGQVRSCCADISSPAAI